MKSIPIKVPTVDLSSLAKQSSQNSNKGFPGFGREGLVDLPPNKQHGNRPNNTAFNQVVTNAMKGK
jgi:hypothetical protein